MRTSIAGLVLFIPGLLFAQSGTNKCSQASRLIQVIEKNHVQPVPVNDTWSERVFINFFDALDPTHLLFTQPDLDSFSQDQNQLDDFVKTEKHCAWINTSSQLLKKQLTAYKLWLQQVQSKSFDYTVKEQFDIKSFPARSFSSSTQTLEAYRRTYLKFLILSRMHTGSVADSSGRSLLSYEPVARKNIIKKELQRIEDIEQQGIEIYAGECFLKAIALAYDPHTSYMSVSEKESFDEALSDENLSFGFSLEEDQTGSFVVVNIIPGGPAWISNSVREGDVLIRFSAVNREINAMDYEAEDLELELNKLTEATFLFRKQDGQFTKIKLVKAKVRSVENTVSGYVLKDTKRIGYIPLPSFYFNRSETESGGAAGDVAKAIIKLNKEGIEGLIIDLRSNGGGSVDEARELAGIFIDFGPIIMGRAADQSIAVLKDLIRGTVYNGPVIIMVNGFSASASELLAATLQDYKRAIIVGGKTYGKGTGQNIYPIPGSTTDFVKVTTMKFYRVNGKTYQHKGVVPDIGLPDVAQSLGYQEDDLPYALSSDSVTKKAYYTPLVAKPLATIVQNSSVRVQQSKAFQHVTTLQHRLLRSVPLDAAGFSEYLNWPEAEFNESFQSLIVTNTAFDNSLLAMDAFRRVENEKSVQEIRKSFYIQEAYHIMLDYINLK